MLPSWLVSPLIMVADCCVCLLLSFFCAKTILKAGLNFMGLYICICMWRNNMSYFHIFHLPNHNSDQCAQVWVTTFLNANYNKLYDIFQACHAYAINITIWSKLIVIIMWHKKTSIQDILLFNANLLGNKKNGEEENTLIPSVHLHS